MLSEDLLIRHVISKGETVENNNNDNDNDNGENDGDGFQLFVDLAFDDPRDNSSGDDPDTDAQQRRWRAPSRAAATRQSGGASDDDDDDDGVGAGEVTRELRSIHGVARKDRLP